MLCFFAGLGVNLTLKFVLYKTSGTTGLAFATAAGAWVNFASLIVLGMSWKWMRPDAKLMENIAITLFSCGALALAGPVILQYVSALYPFALLHKEVAMTIAAGVIFGGYAAIFALCALTFGRSVSAQLQ